MASGQPSPFIEKQTHDVPLLDLKDIELKANKGSLNFKISTIVSNNLAKESSSDTVPSVMPKSLFSRNATVKYMAGKIQLGGQNEPIGH